MTTPHYDLVVIGGGSGGLTAATIAARVRARVLLVDRTRLGGDCLHGGCVPSKALLASAHLAHRMRRAADLGLAPVEVRPDIRAVMARVRGIQAEIGRHESPEAMRAQGVSVMLGGARFVDPFTIVVGDRERVTGARFIVATGSRAEAPPIPGLREAGHLDHGSLFGIDALPARLAVLGGGPIGVEMGQALARLGAKVTILQRAPRLLDREEPELSAHLASALAEEGIDVRLGVDVTRVERRGADKVLTWSAGGAANELCADEVLVAVGRRPVIDALGIDAAGVDRNEKGIVVDDRLETSRKHIYAVGDCAGGPQFTHWAEYEARIAARNALFRGSERRSMRVVPWVTFCDPEVARVGLTEAEARREGLRAHAHRYEFARLDRAITEGRPGGLIKVVVDEERILGAHIVGHGAGEALAEWVLAVQHGLSLADVGRAIHVYPTIGRINRRVADAAFLEHGLPSWLVKLGGRFTPRDE